MVDPSIQEVFIDYTLHDSLCNVHDVSPNMEDDVTGAGLNTSCYTGALHGGPQCHMSNFKNGYLPCHFFSNFHVDSKMVSCCMSNSRNGLCYLDGISGHVDTLHVAC